MFFRRLKSYSLNPPKTTLSLFPINYFLFSLLLFFLPQQFGPHFWPDFSLANGIRLDYLSPSLYVSDILIIFLFLTSFKKVFTTKIFQGLLASPLFLLFLCISFFPLAYAFSPPALLFGLLKLAEFSYVGLFIATQITKKNIPTITGIFAVLGILESILDIFQFIHQGSLGGILYFAGERFFTAGSIGQAVINTSQGLMVRPYGTFPHPNVLAFFLFTAVVFSTYGMHHSKGLKRYIFLLSILITEAGLFLTFSRTTLIVNILFLLYAFGYVSLMDARGRIKKILFSCALILFTAIYVLFFNNRFLSVSSFTHDLLPRTDLISISIHAISQYPLFGTGLNNFYFFEASVQKNFSTVFLQPVHNVFLLIFAQMGLIGGAIFVYFLTVVFLKNLKQVRLEKHIFSLAEVPFILLLSFIFIGSFDHFFLTIQQGELLLALILGLSFARIEKSY